MKNVKIIFVLALALCTHQVSEAINRAGEKVIVEMTDGTTHHAWFHSDVNNMGKYVELSDTPDGEHLRYESALLERITFLPPNENYIETTYRRVSLYTGLNGKKLKEGRWVREDYKGNGITLYSAVNEAARPGLVGGASGFSVVHERKFYIVIGEGPAQFVSENAPNMIGQAGNNRLLLNMFFKKTYPGFAARIKNKEFDTKGSPIEVVRAWEKEYGE